MSAIKTAVINAIGDAYESMPIREVMRGADAILSALDAAGYAVVPIVPTQEMTLAASEFDKNSISGMRNVWSAMLSAAKDGT